MTNPTTPAFGCAWPIDELETLSACPMCAQRIDEARSQIAASDVQDFAFRSAPGRWTYWRCAECEGLFLNPRPKAEFIGNAYKTYYTHEAEASTSGNHAPTLKSRLRSEAWVIGWRADVSPRLHLPQALHRLLRPLARKLYPGFVIEALAKLPRGKLLDVGCGNGRYLEIAQRLGFSAQGLEPDPSAVAAVHARGLVCQLGGYDDLPAMPSNFSVVVASHTLEHTHSPTDALRALLDRLAPGGALVLALPNGQSPVFAAFGMHWRGLEAPRHIAIPARKWLADLLHRWGYRVTSASVSRVYTWAESAAITQAEGAVTRSSAPVSDEPDLIEWIVQKS